jgi:hypothetical protein
MRPDSYEEPKVISCDFEVALSYLKEGRRIMRRCWANQGSYIYLVGPGRYPPSTAAGRAIGAGEADGLVPYDAYIAQFNGFYVVPWTPTAADLLASDWVLGL